MTTRTDLPHTPVPADQEKQMLYENIRKNLPYTAPFLFVDEFTHIDENGANGHYTYKKEEFFYLGHFPQDPVTPGVILIETMAQIGLVGLGFYLTQSHLEEELLPFVFISSEVSFLNKVMPGETVFVESKKQYFRLGKLKCDVLMKNAAGKIVAKGVLSGMIINKNLRERYSK